MSNSGIIATKNKDIIIDLSWNGGLNSIQAFCAYGKLHRYVSPERNWRDMITLVTNFMGNGHCYIQPWSAPKCIPNNGMFFIEDWKIVGHAPGSDLNNVDFFDGQDPAQTKELLDFLVEIDNAQPKDMQLGAEYIRAKEMPTSEIKVGDKVFVYDNLYQRITQETVQGIGHKYTEKNSWGETYELDVCNGRNIIGVPYCNRCHNEEPFRNINNYLLEPSYRVVAA